MVVLEVEQVLDLPEVHEALEVVEGVVGRAAAFGIVPRRIAVPDAPRELVLELQRAAEAPVLVSYMPLAAKPWKPHPGATPPQMCGLAVSTH